MDMDYMDYSEYASQDSETSSAEIGYGVGAVDDRRRPQAHSKMRSQIGAELPHLRRYARTLVHCPAEADDLVQATVERALTREAQWNPNKGLRPWLFRILHNLHVSSVRSRQREFKLYRLHWRTGGVSGSHESYSELNTVRDAMNQLPASHREAILLVAVEGFSYQEAASVMQVPVGTVRSRLSRAREQLRELVQPDINRMTSQRGTS